MTELTRRKLLSSTAVVAGAGLAGCISGSDDDAENGDDQAGSGDPDTGEDGNETSTPENGTDGNGTSDEQAEGLEATIETLGSDCGGADAADVEFGTERITVSGTTPAPNPCHEAVIEESSVGGDGFTLVVGVEAPNPDEECMECVGEVAYEARLSGESVDGISQGTVRHRQGGTHGFAVETETAEMDPEERQISDTAVETVESGCLSETDSRELSMSRRDGGITVEGSVETPNPCHEAVLQDAAIDGTALTVDIAARSTLGEDEMCSQCRGVVQYSARIDLPNHDALETVTVRHPGGESHELDAGSSTGEQ